MATPIQSTGSTNLAAQVANLELLTDTGGTFFESELRLFTAPPAVNFSTPLSDLVEATFTGYAAVELTFNTPSIEAGNAIATANTAAFRPTTSGTTPTIAGWFITENGGASLKVCGTFPEPIPLNLVTQELLLIPYVKPDGSGGVIGV